MPNAIYNVPLPWNEPHHTYAPGTEDRAEVKKVLKELQSKEMEIPLIIGGKEVKSGNLGTIAPPHNHQKVLGHYHKAGEKEVNMAIEASQDAYKIWSKMDWQDRIAVFIKAAELIAGPYRHLINATTMLGQSKTIHQAEIEAVAELCDFLRFNSYFARQIYQEQPPHSPKGIWNRMEHRPLEGFIFAVTPFNFTAIGGNLPSAPALMGNVSLWKPASSAVFSNFHVMKIFMEAGLPPGVINFVPGDGSKVGNPALTSPLLAGVHFTGSTNTFQTMWRIIGENIKKYKWYPRIVGETGGKDFMFVHPSADVEEVGTALVRGAYEYQGQKCSAVSRAYIPTSLWPDLKNYLTKQIIDVKMGDVEDFTNFMGAVIDRAAFNSITEYIEYIKKSDEAEIIIGGEYNDSVGYFIQPTVAVTTNPKFRTMEEEIFGPVLTVYVYDDNKYEETLHLCDETSPYGLTGGIYAKDRTAIVLADRILANAAGNFYINDKPTGSIVGQQPFGGSRASGTNDKAGSPLNLMRWVTARAVKETFVPPRDWRYPYMTEK